MSFMSLPLLLLAPLLAALLGLLPASAVGVTRRAAAWLSLVALGAAVGVWMAIDAGTVPTFGGGFLRADALSTLLALCVTVVSSLSAWLGPGLGAEDGIGDRQVRQFVVLSNLLTFTMLLAVTVDNVGVMWVAIEATTIASAMLVPLRVGKASVEASWKYIMIGSVGIALAFVGTVLAYFDFVHRAGSLEGALNWTVLVTAAPRLHPDVMRLAFVFLLVGYGTKAGLAPMHTWLPDAHSEAPPPLSAVMSGVLLAVATYAIIRWKAVVDISAGPAFASTLLICLALLSIGIAAFSLVSQRSYKRMLAYSSVEHTGLTCLGVALGPAGAFAAMLHMLNHSLAKPVLFLLSGRIHHRYHSSEVAGVSGLRQTMPVTAWLFAAGILAIVGLPPFGMFISELALLRAGFQSGHHVLMAVVLVLLLVVFVSLIGHLNRMLHGDPPSGMRVEEGSRLGLVPLAVVMAAVLCLGLVTPGPVFRLLSMSAEIVSR